MYGSYIRLKKTTFESILKFRRMDHNKNSPLSTKNNSRIKQAKLLRVFRKVHRYTGVFLFFFFFILGASGILLGWKKHSGNILLPATQSGISNRSNEWLSLDSLQKKAELIIKDSFNNNLSTSIDRIDVRPDKGSIKFIFSNHYWEVQLDATTGNLLSLGKRNSDLIERIHDGSIIDLTIFKKNGYFKLIYTSILGVALITFTITGFWLWYGPRLMRKK